MDRNRTLNVVHRTRYAGCLLTIITIVVAGCGESQQQAAILDTATKTLDDAVRWLTDLEEAKQVAAAEGKDLFVLFTGSTWCSPCLVFEREILTTAEFAPVAERFVLVRLDYPQGVRRLPQEPADSPVSWQEYYGNNGIPTVILADTNGKPYALTGNYDLQPLPYREYIEQLRGAHGKRDEAFAKAAAAEGIEKARHLADGLKSLRRAIDQNYVNGNSDPLVLFYRAEIDEVLRLDADGAAGVRGSIDKMLAAAKPVELSAFYALLDETHMEQGIDAALKMLDDKIAATESVKPRKSLRLVRRNYLEQSDRFEEALALSRELAIDESMTAEERFRHRQRMAWNLWRLNRQEESLALFDELFAESAKYPWRLLSLAQDNADCLQFSGRFADALSTWEQLIPLFEPRSGLLNEAQLARIRLLARLGRADDAWDEFDRLSATGWMEPIDSAAEMVLISAWLNEHGSRDAALSAAAKAEQALDQAVTNDEAEAEAIARLRQTLESIKAGPQTKRETASDPPATTESK